MFEFLSRLCQAGHVHKLWIHAFKQNAVDSISTGIIPWGSMNARREEHWETVGVPSGCEEWEAQVAIWIPCKLGSARLSWQWLPKVQDPFPSSLARQLSPLKVQIHWKPIKLSPQCKMYEHTLALQSVLSGDLKVQAV